MKFGNLCVLAYCKCIVEFRGVRLFCGKGGNVVKFKFCKTYLTNRAKSDFYLIWFC